MGPKERKIDALYRFMSRSRFRRWYRDPTEENFAEWFEMVKERFEMMKLARKADQKRQADRRQT